MKQTCPSSQWSRKQLLLLLDWQDTEPGARLDFLLRLVCFSWRPCSVPVCMAIVQIGRKSHRTWESHGTLCIDKTLFCILDTRLIRYSLVPSIQNKPGDSHQDPVDHVRHTFSIVPKGSVDSHVDQDIAAGLTNSGGWGMSKAS